MQIQIAYVFGRTNSVFADWASIQFIEYKQQIYKEIPQSHFFSKKQISPPNLSGIPRDPLKEN